MTYNVRTAQRLLSGPETALYRRSRKAGLHELSEKQLQRSMIRARRLHERLAERAGRPHRWNADSSTRSTLTLEILRRFERQFAAVLMNSGQHNQRTEATAQVTAMMQQTLLGPHGEDSVAREHEKSPQNGGRRSLARVAAKSRRRRARNDGH